LIKQLLNRFREVSLLPAENDSSSNKNNDLCDSFCPSNKVALLKDKVLEVVGLSEIFKVLGDETRTKILYLLSYRELCVCDLAEILAMSLPAISHHLRLLRALHLVKYRREGKMVYYALDDEHIVHLIREAQEHFAEGR
jgi:DNA-binding transcriptional ArsR family regulator